MYGAKFYDKPRDPLNVADIAGASPMAARRQLTNDPRLSFTTVSARAIAFLVDPARQTGLPS